MKTKITALLSRIVGVKVEEKSVIAYLAGEADTAKAVKRISEAIIQSGLSIDVSDLFRNWADQQTKRIAGGTKFVVAEGFIESIDDRAFVLGRGDIVVVEKQVDISKGLATALSKTANLANASSTTCKSKECGFTFPKYKGNYPNFCPMCGTGTIVQGKVGGDKLDLVHGQQALPTKESDMIDKKFGLVVDPSVAKSTGETTPSGKPNIVAQDGAKEMPNIPNTQGNPIGVPDSDYRDDVEKHVKGNTSDVRDQPDRPAQLGKCPICGFYIPDYDDNTAHECEQCGTALIGSQHATIDSPKVKTSLNPGGVSEAQETKTVIADKNTGSMWGGIFPGDDADKKLKNAQKKNSNYIIMSFEDAEKLAKKSKKEDVTPKTTETGIGQPVADVRTQPAVGGENYDTRSEMPPTPIQQVACPVCGFWIPQYADKKSSFCPNCGTALSGEVEDSIDNVNTNDIVAGGADVVEANDIEQKIKTQIVGKLNEKGVKSLSDAEMKKALAGTVVPDNLLKIAKKLIADKEMVMKDGKVALVKSESLSESASEEKDKIIDIAGKLPKGVDIRFPGYSDGDPAHILIVNETSDVTEWLAKVKKAKKAGKVKAIFIKHKEYKKEATEIVMACILKLSESEWKITIDNGAVFECDADGLHRFLVTKVDEDAEVDDIRENDKTTLRLIDGNLDLFI